MNPSAVLHVLALHGGGVDRHVRDIVATVAGPHWLWHVGDRAEVLEGPGERRFHPLDPARADRDPAPLADWLRSHRIGLVHLHSVARAPRARAQWATRQLGLPLVVTLHDVLFLRADAFEFEAPEADPAWTGELAPVLREAKAVLAPSEYIAASARACFPGLAVEVVPNGIDAARFARRGPLAPRAEFLARRPAHVVAVLGAVGAHKGAELLRALPALLAGSGIGIVVIGYLDRQLRPGWVDEGGLYVHGPYHPDDAAGLLRAYDARLVLFPNRAPESFSYSLSEAWAAGLPVVAGPGGAIGERVRRHGGGWLLGARFDAAETARALRGLCGGASAGELARVKSQLALPDPGRIPTLRAMAESLDAYYRRYGTASPSGAPDAGAIEPLLAPSLDSTLFRGELAHLADLCDQDGEHWRAARAFETEARAWIAKLEGDVRDLQSQLRREFEERTRLAAELAEIRDADAFAARLPRFARRILAALFRHARH